MGKEFVVLRFHGLKWAKEEDLWYWISINSRYDIDFYDLKFKYCPDPVVIYDSETMSLSEAKRFAAEFNGMKYSRTVRVEAYTDSPSERDIRHGAEQIFRNKAGDGVLVAHFLDLRVGDPHADANKICNWIRENSRHYISPKDVRLEFLPDARLTFLSPDFDMATAFYVADMINGEKYNGAHLCSAEAIRIDARSLA